MKTKSTNCVALLITRLRLQLFHDCSANHWTSFYMIGTSAMHALKHIAKCLTSEKDELPENVFVDSQFNCAFVIISEDSIFRSGKDSPYFFSYVLILLC